MVKEKNTKREVTDIEVICKVLSDKGICSTHEFARAKATLEEN